MSSGTEGGDRPAFFGPSEPTPIYREHLGDPGCFPFTRGRRGSTTTSGGWIHRELSGEGDPRRSNQQLRDLLANGARGIDVIGDNPTQSALDPDHPMCQHAVGTTGVSICRAADFVELLDGIPLDEVTLSHSLPAAFAIAGQYLAAKALGFDPAILRGSSIQGPLYTEDCAYAMFLPYDVRLRLALDSIEFSLEHMPRFHPYLEDTYFISDGGLDIVEEMSLGFVQLREITRQLLGRGVPVDRFAPRIAMLVNCRMSLFEEIAKVRATRRLFARMMRDEFGALDDRSCSVNIAVHTSGLSLTAAQPVNNIARGALQGFAMAMAGVQGLEISTFDEPFRTPSPDAHVVALRSQQILQNEVGVGDVVDPLGGSWYIEHLTDDLEARIEAEVRRIESAGGIADLVEQGYFRSVFHGAMDRHSRRIQSGELRVVGVNCHTLPPDRDQLLRSVAEERFAVDRDHVERIRAWRSTRDAAAVEACLDRVSAACAGGGDLMGPIVESLASDVTIGEITGALRRGVGLDADPFARSGTPRVG